MRWISPTERPRCSPAIGEGRANAQIARRLHISVRTVENHVSSLLRKYAVADRHGLAEIVQAAEALRSARPIVGLPASRPDHEPLVAIEVIDAYYVAAVLAIGVGDMPAALAVGQRADVADPIGDHPYLGLQIVRRLRPRRRGRARGRRRTVGRPRSAGRGRAVRQGERLGGGLPGPGGRSVGRC